MSLHLKVSNSLSHLSAEMAKMLQQNKTEIFVPSYIVTQTDGMNVWLKQQLVQHLSIVANTHFIKPNDFILKVYSLLGGSFEKTISKDNLMWVIFQLLSENDFLKRFPIQAAYFKHDDEDLKRMGLAEKMADLFDQYQIFRPEIIKQWNSKKADDSSLDWQAYLWVQSKHIVAEQLPDKTILQDFILEKLKDKALCTRLQNAMPQLFLFGLSILTKFHLNLIAAIGEVVEIHFYLQNPAPNIYWLDDRSEKEISIWRQKGVSNTDSQIVGNPLLTSWGKVLRNTFSLLFKNEQLLNEYEILETESPARNSLLSKIQEDIYENRTTDRNRITIDDLKDETIVIQSCYTVAREVDALYQYLVYLVDQKQEILSSRDIVVMVNNIDLYAPFIKTVFENAPYKFKFRISDNATAQTDNLLIALQQILQLNEENFTSESVLQLLELSSICKRFELKDIDRIRRVVEAANIRFGTYGNENDETELVSWQYGIKRIMYGLCMLGEQEFEHSPTFYPLDILEGNEGQELIRFCHFIQVLVSAIQDRNKQRTIAEWVNYVSALIENLLVDKDQINNADVAAYSSVQSILEKYSSVESFVQIPLSYELFVRNFIATISSESNTGLYFNEGITFCSFIPMRSIPFKVVAMLGLDFASFPRNEKKINFSLITQKPELGDRNVKDNDKHLFLETLLSAKQYFYISYLGKSITDNSPKPASVMVEELIDYIQSGTEEKDDLRKSFVVQQPLHHFSKRYNKQDKSLYRYSTKHLGDSNLFLNNDKNTSEIDFSTIKVSELIAFYKNGIKSFFQKRLSIYYNDEDFLLPETEIFSLDHLGLWNLKNVIIAHQKPTLLLRNEMVKKGILPLKNIADLTLENLETELELFQILFAKHSIDAQNDQIAIQLEIDDCIIEGSLFNVFHQKLVQVCFSKNILKTAIEGYLQVLTGIASNDIKEWVIIYGPDLPQDFFADLSLISVDEANIRLSKIVSFFKFGCTEMIPFIEPFFAALLQDEDWKANELKIVFEKKINDFTYPIDDPYLLKAWDLGLFDEEGFYQHLNTASELILKPLLQVFPNLPTKIK